MTHLQSFGNRTRGALSVIAVLAICAGTLAGAISSAHGQAAKPAEFSPRVEDPAEFPAGAGRDDTFYGCTACHGFRLVAQQGMSRDRWDETLTYMTVRHKMPDIQGRERAAMLDYLAGNFGPKIGKSKRGWINPFTPQ